MANRKTTPVGNLYNGLPNISKNWDANWMDRMKGNIIDVDKDSLFDNQSFKIDPTSIPASKKFSSQ